MSFLSSIRRAVALVCCASLLTACPNSFSEFANRTSDEALLFQAEQYADARDWDNAITTIGRMSSGGLAERTTKYALASYYAGRCGLDLLELADALTGLSTTDLFPLLLSEFSGLTTTDLADCETAEDTILSISTSYSSLTTDENLLLAFIEFVKIGAVLGSNANIDADENGTYDGDYWDDTNAVDICDEAGGGRNDVTDAEINKIITGVMIAYNALTASGSDIASDLGSVGSICTTLGGCNIQETADVTNAQRLIVRGMFKSNEIGFDTCGGTYTTDNAGRNNDCFCPTTP